MLYLPETPEKKFFLNVITTSIVCPTFVGTCSFNAHMLHLYARAPSIQSLCTWTPLVYSCFTYTRAYSILCAICTRVYSQCARISCVCLYSICVHILCWCTRAVLYFICVHSLLYECAISARACFMYTYAHIPLYAYMFCCLLEKIISENLWKTYNNPKKGKLFTQPHR